MQVIGFNFTKISAQRTPEKFGKFKKNMNFEFDNIEKENVNFLKDMEAAKISFKHSLTYENLENKKANHGEITFEGNILLGLTKDESKDLQKSWKKKEISNSLRMALSNVLLQKCTSKTIQLQHELNLPSHVAFPRLTQQN